MLVTLSTSPSAAASLSTTAASCVSLLSAVAASAASASAASTLRSVPAGSAPAALVLGLSLVPVVQTTLSFFWNNDTDPETAVVVRKNP